MRIATILLLGSLLLFSLTCSQPKKKTYVVICFDVEDYITPASEGVDDIPKWIADTMSEVGVTGTFFVIVEKARSLEKRGRQDVIQAMARHDIGSHTNYGSIHPTVTEILEKADWEQGVKTMYERESAGIDELQRIFGVPVSTLARHGGSYGPQLVYALSRMGKGYVYSPIHLPGHHAVWFCNTLNFYGDYGSFDDTYYRDDLFNPNLDSLKANFAKDIEGIDVINFFACHPCKVRTVQFWDFNYYYGANPDSSQWKTPELRPLESMKTARKNFRRLMEFLKSRDDIQITTYRELMKRFSYQKDEIQKKDLTRLAHRVINEKAVVIDDYFSPAELFSALTRSIVDYAETGSIASSIGRRAPLGPMQMPIEQPELEQVTREQVNALARAANAYIIEHNSLPAWLDVDGKRIGTGSLLALFSNLYLDIVAGKPAAQYAVLPFDAYPKENAEAIIADVRACKTWPVHRPDLDMSNLVEMTKMQLWTLKPALES